MLEVSIKKEHSSVCVIVDYVDLLILRTTGKAESSRMICHVKTRIGLVHDVLGLVKADFVATHRQSHHRLTI